MRLLLFIFLAMCSAQQPSLDDINNWVLSSITTPKSTTTTKFNIRANARNRPSTSCTTTDGKEGKCVKPQYCIEQLPEVDSATLFIYRETTCTYTLQCCPLDQVKPVPKKTNTLPKGCGWSNPGGYNIRASNSDDTGFSDFADFPWMVALLKRSFGNQWSPNDYIGGGTLIHPSVVLTVAHKVDIMKADELKCRAGEWDFKMEDEIYIHQDRNVRKITKHNNFWKLHAHYNAALLFLETPYEMGKEYHIGTACLARSVPLPGATCYSMGWGRTINKDEKTGLLKKIQLPVVDSETCQRQLRKTRLGLGFNLHNTLCCAGGELGKDTCIGDGGSPLACLTTSYSSLQRYLVHGMVVYGLDGCGLKDIPGVYANVPAMLDWIDRQMEGEQYGTETYYMS